jgi:peptidoglycan hydrolase FlgJ
MTELVGAPLPLVGTTGSRLPSPAGEASPEVQRAAREFESMFLAEMLAPMFESLDTEGLGGGGMGEQIFRPMLVERYAEAISRSGGVGLADSLISELNRLQAAPMTEPE